MMRIVVVVVGVVVVGEETKFKNLQRRKSTNGSCYCCCYDCVKGLNQGVETKSEVTCSDESLQMVTVVIVVMIA